MLPACEDNNWFLRVLNLKAKQIQVLNSLRVPKEKLFLPELRNQVQIALHLFDFFFYHNIMEFQQVVANALQ